MGTGGFAHRNGTDEGTFSLDIGGSGWGWDLIYIVSYQNETIR